jgi:hypothetical protein
LRILVVSQYFWPENFRINEIVKFLKEKNYEVDVLTGYPNYPEESLALMLDLMNLFVRILGLQRD